jgi:hypothetical protein
MDKTDKPKSVREVMEKFRQAEWICVNDKDDTDEKRENRLTQALTDIYSLLASGMVYR